MSLSTLRSALTSLPATGPNGFEGLAATLLTALAGDRYFIARSGDQPADAVTSTGDVALQGKRYDRTPLNETEFEGDFSKACRLCPNLDCYVLATTQVTAQLKGLAEDLQQRTGVDVILIGFDEIQSDLPSLCVTFWNELQAFVALSRLGPEFASWAATQAKRPEVIATIERLRSALKNSIPLATTVRENLNAFLNIRFGKESAANRPMRFVIRVADTVIRAQQWRELENWWTAGQRRSCVIEGEEGMGKSWVAAAFAEHLLQNGTALIIWLDSADWSGLRTIEAVIDIGLLQAGFGDSRLRERLVRKALTRWSDRLLLMLDGVNERNARETAHHLLAQINSFERQPCRLLFTTRPIKWNSDERSLWAGAARVLVDRFTDQEFHKALERPPTPVSPTEISAGLAEVARIPRYFERAVQLRQRFKTLSNVSKEMVLWADLIAKVQAGDAQVRTDIGWSSPADIRRSLVKLATAARAVHVNEDATAANYSLLQSCFGAKFEDIRNDLVEQRVVLEPAEGHLAPSKEHLALGFGLYLGSVAARQGDCSVAELAECFQRELEPVAAQDAVTEALFVALQLSAFPSSEGLQLSSKARAALLLAWTSNQNSRVVGERLLFWAKEDLTAYLDFTEEVFVAPVSDGWLDLITAPLAQLWRCESTLTELESRLRRWVKLIWKSHDLPSSDGELVHSGYSLPVAKNRSQLTLAFVAIAVLSERPLPSFLPDLAIAWSTDGLCTVRHRWQNPNNPGATETQDVPCKDLKNNIAVLLRWVYTETAKGALHALQQAETSGALIQRGASRMVKAFDQFGWRRFRMYEKGLRAGQPLFSTNPEEAEQQFANCPELAVRDDFPDLCENDRAVIAAKVENLLNSTGVRSNYSRTFADDELEHYLPWFARYCSSKLAELGAQFRLSALDWQQIGPALNFANNLPFAVHVLEPGSLLNKAKSAAEREHKTSQQRFYWSLMQLHVLAFTCLTGAELKEWLAFASQIKPLRREIHFYPLPVLCPLLVPQELAMCARQHMIRCSDEPPSDSEVSEAEFDFWAWIVGLATDPDLQTHQWIEHRIRTQKPTGDRLFYSLLVWFRTAARDQLKDAIVDGSIVDFMGDDGWWLMHLSGRFIDDWSQLSLAFNTLVEKMPIDDVGTLLLVAKRSSDLNRWAHLAFEKALDLIGHPPLERKYWGTTILTTGASGEIVGATCDDEPTVAAAEGESLRPVRQDLWSALTNVPSDEQAEHEANEGLRIWKEDQQQLKTIEAGAFDSFGAMGALETWRDQNQRAFGEYSRRLLEFATRDASKVFHLGGFLSRLLDALAPIDLEFATRMCREISEGSLRLTVTTHYGVETFIAVIWRESAKQGAKFREACKQMLLSSMTDEELMRHAITAQAEGAAEVLRSICADLRASELAKERCAAVSVLAWIAGPHDIEKLDQLARQDPSGWVRDHSEWAAEVARQEAAARRHYRRTLIEVERNTVVSRLQVLRPALTPASLWWHREIEAEEKVCERAPSQVQAALELFWYDSKNQCKKTPELFGRSLKEYLRGDRLRDVHKPLPRLI